VAFVRQGSHIGLVDANGVLLDMPVDSGKNAHYSFPVVTGISANDPQSTRAARMKIFGRFTSELDASGEKISEELSEVDLSNPEDVQALIPDRSTEILVHFGEDSFLDRYRRFKEHLPEWRTLYPKLSSVDMRYERQVVLQMPPGSNAPAVSSSNVEESGTSVDSKAASTNSPVGAAAVGKPVVKPGAKSIDKPGIKPSAKAPPVVAKHAAGTKPATKAPAHVKAHSEVGFDVPANKSAPKTKTHAAAANHHPVATKHPAGAAQTHPTQVVHP
jgi:cell division protein FtsQ